MKKAESDNRPVKTIPVEFHIVHRDELGISGDGISPGKWLDETIRYAKEAGESVGKVKLDLSALFE